MTGKVSTQPYVLLPLGLFLLGSAGCAGGTGPADGGGPGLESDAGEPDGGADAGPGTGATDGGLDAGPPTLGAVSAAALHAELAQKDFLLVDVHVPRAGVVPGTDQSIPYTDVDGLAAFVGPNLDERAVLTCLGGHMSDEAGRALASRGYRAVRQLTGGMNAWVAAGYTLDP